MLAQEPVVFWRVLLLKLGSSAGGDSLRFLLDFLKLASLACSPDGPGLDELSGLDDPGRDSLGFGRLTLGLKRDVHSNLDDPAALGCSLSRLLLRGEGEDAERERRDLLWSLPCFSRAPCGGAQLFTPVAAEEEEEEDAEEEEAEEEEESVTALHPALADAAGLDASLEGLTDRPASLRGGGGPPRDEEEDDEDEEEEEEEEASAFLRL